MRSLTADALDAAVMDLCAALSDLTAARGRLASARAESEFGFPSPAIAEAAKVLAAVEQRERAARRAYVQARDAHAKGV